MGTFTQALPGTIFNRYCGNCQVVREINHPPNGKRSESLIAQIDECIPYPGPEHYNAIQKIWIRDYQWCLNEKREGGVVDFLKALELWNDSPQQLAHQDEYARRYILNKRLDLKRVNLGWVDSFLARLVSKKGLDDYKGLCSKI